MQPYVQIDIEVLNLKKQLEEIQAMKRRNPLTQDDIESVSDNYQHHLEMNYSYGEIQDKLKELEFQASIPPEQMEEVLRTGCPHCGSYEGDATECPECGHGQ